MWKIKVYKQKTVLVKWNWDKILVDVPFEAIEKSMNNETIKIAEGHYIRTKAINERYAYNVTDEIEVYIDDNFPDHSQEIKKIIDDRRKAWQRVNKEIVNIIHENIININ